MMSPETIVFGVLGLTATNNRELRRSVRQTVRIECCVSFSIISI